MTLEMTPLHPRFGMRVEGVDLSAVTAEIFADIRAAFEAHSLLLFPGQDMDDAAHLALAGMFGPIEDRLADERKPGETYAVPEVSNIGAGGRVVAEDDLHMLNLRANMLWHADSTFLPAPALANLLIARQVTQTGGQTEFASTRAAFADMPPERQEDLRGRAFWHRYAHSRARISRELAALPMFHKWPEQLWRAVWRNPVNGREAVYVASHAYAVEGMEARAGAEMIETLLEDVTRDEYVFSHTWNVGDVIVWDQRAVLHRARPWDARAPRRLTSLCVSATPADGREEMKPVGDFQPPP